MMREFFSLPNSAKDRAISRTALWLSQGLLLVVTGSSYILIVKELQKYSAQADELLQRFESLNQKMARLAEEVSAIRADLAKAKAVSAAVSAPSRSQGKPKSAEISQTPLGEKAPRKRSLQRGTQKTASKPHDGTDSLPNNS